MFLTRATSITPDESEVAVFRTLVAQLVLLLKQLESSYHVDRYLRERLIPAVDIPHIRNALRDRVLRMAQQSLQRLASRVGSDARTAGSIANANLTIYADQGVEWDQVEGGGQSLALYSLGQSYGGQEKSPVKSFLKRSRGRQKPAKEDQPKMDGRCTWVLFLS